MVKILLSGACGKMGRVIARCVAERTDCVVAAGVDLFGEAYGDFPVYKAYADCKDEADVIIDFSNPSALDDLLSYAKEHQLPLVLATTGYNDEQLAKIRKASADIPIFFTFNMSLGINLLITLAKKAAAVLGDQFDIEIVEKHHNQKVDAPSGTAIMIANAINEERGKIYHYEYDRHAKRAKRDPKEIGMHAIRGGTIVGEHDVIFAGHDEVLTISHQAQSKEIFAVGSINAALFLVDQKPGMYDMSQVV